MRFKGKNQMDTVKGKSNSTGIRWREDHVEWLGLNLPALTDYQDPVIVCGLSNRVKYVWLVRRKISGGILPLLPVRTEGPIPVRLLRSCMLELAQCRVKAPVRAGQVILENIAGTGVRVIASRELPVQA